MDFGEYGHQRCSPPTRESESLVHIFITSPPWGFDTTIAEIVLAPCEIVMMPTCSMGLDYLPT